MKVLFVGSGNKNNDISIILRNQSESLNKNGIEVIVFPIIGKGIRGYLKNISNLKKFLSENKVDVIHAHYSFSAYICAIAGARPLVATLMGSDVYVRVYYRLLNRFFNHFFWSACIVKSKEMARISDIKDAFLIPNGVDLITFNIVSKDAARKKLGLDSGKRYILFAADPERKEKNFLLAKKAIDIINKEVDLLIVYNKTQEDLNMYFNAVDVVLLTSHYEGSPNVIKEAMSCNSPIVTTNVGDVKWILGETQGCWISSFDVKELAKKIEMALDFASQEGRTNGRERIIDLGLDSESISKRISEVYYTVTKSKQFSVENNY
jgi:teichuronic acid biosynthesis glycosyltransferase TuaC